MLPGSLELTPDGTQALYLADPVTEGHYELYRVPTDGSAFPVALDVPLAPGEQVLELAVAPDGEHVVVQAGSPSGPSELYRVPIAGGPVLDYGTRALGSVPVRFDVAPDSAFVFYLGEAFDVYELFSVSFDASAAPRRLNSPLPAGGNVGAFLPLTCGRVLYHADQETDDVAELFEGFSGRALPAPR